MKQYTDSRDAIFEELFSIALQDPRVVVLSADTGAFIFKEFKKRIPNQFFNIGIAEQNMISVAGGLALEGKRVFVFGISNFVTLRCFEQIRLDICSMGLPITILGMGAGYTYSADGPTHHITEDVAVMRTLPNMTIFSPSDYTQMAMSVHLAYRNTQATYIRIDKGPLPKLYEASDEDFSSGLRRLKHGKDITLVATGAWVGEAIRIAEGLESVGLEVGVIDLFRIKPVNENLLRSELAMASRVATFEEHSIIGGLGSLVAEVLSQSQMPLPLKIFGTPDQFRSEVGSREKMREFAGLDRHRLPDQIHNWCVVDSN